MIKIKFKGCCIPMKKIIGSLKSFFKLVINKSKEMDGMRKSDKSFKKIMKTLELLESHKKIHEQFIKDINAKINKIKKRAREVLGNGVKKGSN